MYKKICLVFIFLFVAFPASATQNQFYYDNKTEEILLNISNSEGFAMHCFANITLPNRYVEKIQISIPNGGWNETKLKTNTTGWATINMDCIRNKPLQKQSAAIWIAPRTEVRVKGLKSEYDYTPFAIAFILSMIVMFKKLKAR